MFTRRTATVTISAPDASTAAAFCSKLLYFPVPTMSREMKRRPATSQPSSISAAADKGDDLIFVAILHLDLAQGRARHDLEIALDRDLGRVEPELQRQLGNAEAGRDAAMLAVDADREGAVLDHSARCLCACPRRVI